MLKLPKVIKHQEALELFSKAKNVRDKLLLEVIYYCGLRVSEAINFKREFAEAVRSGKKRQTIRAPRKRNPSTEGCRLCLYTGMSTPKCEKLR